MAQTAGILARLDVKTSFFALLSSSKYQNMPNRLNKFAMVGGLLCGFANLLAIVSLATPDWVTNDLYGKIFLPLLCVLTILININCDTVPDWKLCHANGRSSVRTSNSTCANENLGAHIFVQEFVGCACKTNKNKVIFEWISSFVNHRDLGAKQQVFRCASFFKRVPFRLGYSHC